jgi:2-C-methyl-D-erythritol 2,4-cyclodiphosphate synthase
MRIGSGIDLHAFDPAASEPGGTGPDGAGPDGGGPDDGGSDATVVLAGVRLPSHAALVGHSDADVVAHAVADALLGAMAAGDLGTRFGVDVPELAGADSMRLLAEVVDELAGAGLAVANLDVTVVAARPRIGPVREAMRANLAAVLGVGVERVSVKATTTDGLGAVGRGEGVAAWATCLVVER